jgi:PhnB protein
MANSPNPIPQGYHTLNVYIMVNGAERAIEFYKQALGAKEVDRFTMPDGKIGHAELEIGDSRLMLADDMPEVPEVIAKSPSVLGGTSFGFHVYVPDVDAAFSRAQAAGGIVKRPVKDQFYGDRSGTFEDPFGHVWTISTHIEDVSPEEMQRRAAAYSG